MESVFLTDSYNITWNTFCGNATIRDHFWDMRVSNFTIPDVTRCFQLTVLTWIPCFYFLLISPFYVAYLSRQKIRHGIHQISNLNWIKTALCIGDVICCILLIIWIGESGEHGRDVTPAEYVAAAFKLVSYIVALFLTPMEFRRGVISSGVMFIFWLLMTVSEIVQLRSNILQMNNPHSWSKKDVASYKPYYNTYNVYFLFLGIQFALSLVPDMAARRRHRPSQNPLSERTPLINQGPADEDDSTENALEPCPELVSPFWARLTFWWFTPTVVRGYFKPFDFSDLPDLKPSEKVKNLYPPFQRLLYGKHRQEGDGSLPVRSVFKALFLCVGYMNVLSLLVRMMSIVCAVISPFILQWFILWLNDKKDHNNVPDYKWKGPFLGALMFFTSFMQSLFLHRFLHICFVVGLQMRTLVNSAVYRKLLRLSPGSRAEVQNQVVNLVATDAQRIQDCTAYMTLTWTVPVLVIVVIVFLAKEIGYSCLAGLAVLGFLIPFNSIYLSSIIRNLQKQQMTDKDKRVGLTDEILKGMKILKLYAWEIPFRDKVIEYRDQELESIRKINYINAFGSVCWLATPYLVSLAMFGTYVYTKPESFEKNPDENHILTPLKAFKAQALIQLLNFPLSMLPQGISSAIQAWVSVKRIGEFMMKEELDGTAVIQDPGLGYTAIKIEQGDFRWSRTEREILRQINLVVPRGSLVAVVGSVGAGKTSLISAMLGEMYKMKGRVRMNGTLAYVPQQAWIQLATLKDNILFGKPCNQDRYNSVIEACALKRDLEQLQPDGDQTEIGERGINLSGGQKQRVSIARAVYQDADIYLMDDPLSAVDAHVGKHIFDNVIGKNGILSDKTRVLVTHGITFLPYVDHVVVLAGGIITEQGTYDELVENGGDFSDFIRTFLQEEGATGVTTDDELEEVDRLRGKLTPDSSMEDLHKIAELKEVEMSILPPSRSRGLDFLSLPAAMRSFSQPKHSKHLRQQSFAARSLAADSNSVSGLRMRSRTFRTPSVVNPMAPISTETVVEEAAASEAIADSTLIRDETVEKGLIRLDVLWSYIKGGKVALFVLVIITHLLLILSMIGANLWLSKYWTNETRVNGTYTEEQKKNDVMGYGLLVLGQVAIGLIESAAVAYGCYAAAHIFHQRMLHRIMRAPMAFFDTTPLGRIVNRFSKDVDALDTNLPILIRQWLFAVAPVINVIVIIAVSAPLFLAFLVVPIIIFLVAQRFYIATARQLKRIDNVKRSPLFNHFNESICGLSSIRAYRRQDEFTQTCDRLVDESQRAWFLIVASQRWCGMTMETLGAFIVLFSVLFNCGNDDANQAGLAVCQALSVTVYLNAWIRNASDLETYIVSAERIDQYSKVDQEKPWRVEDSSPAQGWPRQGRITFNNYSTSYRPGLPPVLRQLTCVIKPGEKVGIVGRTGAGKSSLSLALFRIMEATGGHIAIDGLHIAAMGLHDLRSQITVIPQDPVVFSGSLRQNLDPFDQYSDTAVWAALEHAHLHMFVETLPSKLDHECGEEGAELSVGQRQLLCLARALLRKTKILVLDEATAGIDWETDALVQNTIRTQFKECTVLTVAHRLNTVMDYDRIMVLDFGQIKEFDSPTALKADKSTQFHDMVKKAGLLTPTQNGASS